MIVFYTQNVHPESFTLTGDENVHCVKTLRHRVGDVISAFDKNGHLYKGTITEIGKHETLISIDQTQYYKDKSNKLALAFAPTKAADRVEILISRAVEVGLDHIYIIHTEHTERTRYKADRLERIILSACKQSLNYKIPSLEIIDNLYDLAEKWTDYDCKLIGHCQYKEPHLLHHPMHSQSKVLILIGPEGDFSEHEVTWAKEKGCVGIGLGNTRLRTETAGIVAVSIARAKIDEAQ